MNTYAIIVEVSWLDDFQTRTTILREHGEKKYMVAMVGDTADELYKIFSTRWKIAIIDKTTLNIQEILTTNTSDDRWNKLKSVY